MLNFNTNIHKIQKHWHVVQMLSLCFILVTYSLWPLFRDCFTYKSNTSGWNPIQDVQIGCLSQSVNMNAIYFVEMWLIVSCFVLRVSSTLLTPCIWTSDYIVIPQTIGQLLNHMSCSNIWVYGGISVSFKSPQWSFGCTLLLLGK